ncbi:hypothetical protein B0O99DRAFT_725451, partial [Bisporella sp. PMI_857]
MQGIGEERIVSFVQWINWLAMDMSADLSWNEKMNHMKDMRNINHLDVLLGFNRFTTTL